jgi:hypothetical protein
MPDVAAHVLALLSSFCGMAWFALAISQHFERVLGPGARLRARPLVLRALGCVALFISLVACFFADHPTMAPLVWVMTLTLAALGVAFTLALRPRLLVPLAIGLKETASPSAKSDRR